MTETKLTIYRGKKSKFKVTVYESGSIKDLTGATARMKIGDIDGGTTTVDVAGTISAPLTGVVEYDLSEVNSALLLKSRYDFQFMVADLSGIEKPVVEGFMGVKGTLP